MITACQALECFQFAHRHEAHVRTSGKPCSVDCTCSEPGFNFPKVDTDIVFGTKDVLYQAL